MILDAPPVFAHVVQTARMPSVPSRLASVYAPLVWPLMRVLTFESKFRKTISVVTPVVARAVGLLRAAAMRSAREGLMFAVLIRYMAEVARAAATAATKTIWTCAAPTFAVIVTSWRGLPI